jgi:hypothetical protein
VGSRDLDLGMQGVGRAATWCGLCAAAEDAAAKGAWSCGVWASQRPKEGVADGGEQQAQDGTAVSSGGEGKKTGGFTTFRD